MEQAKRKLLAHAPAVSSPLRRRVSSRTILASRLAATSITQETDGVDGRKSTNARMLRTDNDSVERDDEEGEEEGEALLETYRARVKCVLSSERKSSSVLTAAPPAPAASSVVA